jgi:choline/glycine/proline betaine transport protein
LGWWIAWSPFVGMFIARISKGRTVREFILGVLLVPSIVTFLDFSFWKFSCASSVAW